MKTLCLILLFHGSLQLQCDKGQIKTHIGGDFILTCKYDTNRFLYSKKYWCRGDSRNTCEIIVDSESGTKTTNTHRSYIIDAGRRGVLFVKVTNLQLDDTGVYWVGIDKVYADIMTTVSLVVTEVPVSKPNLRPLSSLEDRLTCWGQPVTVRCGCTRGTSVHYTWFQQSYRKDVLLHHSPDLSLHCGTVDEDSDYYCVASNDISREGSDVLSVQVLMSGDDSCVYVINIEGQPVYDCAGRMSTTTTAPLTTSQAALTQASSPSHCETGNQSVKINQTDLYSFFSREWTGVPLWYTMLRWGVFLWLLICLCIIAKCTTARRKRAKRKRVVCFTHTHLAK